MIDNEGADTIMEFKENAIKDKQTKSQILAEIAENSGLTKKEVALVLEALGVQAVRHLKGRGSGEFTVPFLGVKLRRVRKPATKARKGINPFTGEEIMIKAKPATNGVKATALKALKDAAQ
jgi:nucleoid DNA-binding protein